VKPYRHSGRPVKSDVEYLELAREQLSEWWPERPATPDELAEQARYLRIHDERGIDDTMAWRHEAEAWIIALTDEGPSYPIGVHVDTGELCSGRLDWSGDRMAPGHDESERVRVTNRNGYTLAFGRRQLAAHPEAPQPAGHWTQRCPLCRLTFRTDAWTARCLSCGTALNDT
jgi:hypothetical protein